MKAAEQLTAAVVNTLGLLGGLSLQIVQPLVRVLGVMMLGVVTVLVFLDFLGELSLLGVVEDFSVALRSLLLLLLLLGPGAVPLPLLPVEVVWGGTWVCVTKVAEDRTVALASVGVVGCV
jgi:hypothetical protein